MQKQFDNYLFSHFYTTQLTVSLAAAQVKPMSCDQLETSILGSDWLQLTGIGWVAAELTVS